jgi:hypothetical protein
MEGFAEDTTGQKKEGVKKKKKRIKQRGSRFDILARIYEE